MATADFSISAQVLSDAIHLLQSDDNSGVVRLLKDLIPNTQPVRNAAFVYGLALWKLGDYVPARQSLLKELEHFPDNLEAQQLLPELEATIRTEAPTQYHAELGPITEQLKTLFTQGRPDEILELLNPDKLLGPPPKRFHTLRAFAFIIKGQLGSAHEALWEELRYYPESLEPREHLANLDPEQVTGHIMSSLPSRLNYELGKTVLGLSMLRHGTIPGSIFYQSRDPAPDHGRNMRYLSALAELQVDRVTYAAEYLIEEIGDFPDNQRAIDLFTKLLRALPEGQASQLEQRFDEARKKKLLQKPYVVFSGGIDTPYSGRVYDVPQLMLGPVYRLAKDHFDTTLITSEGREGLQGTNFVLGCLRVERKPDAVVVMRPWWGEESIIALAAREMGIPVVVMFYGATFYACPSAAVRSSILPASVCCVWSIHDYQLSREAYNCKEPLIITGNPMFDPIVENERMAQRTIPNLPENYALVLTSTHGYEADRIYAAAEHLSNHIPVIIKAHPLEPDLGRWSSRWPTFYQSNQLLELLYRSSVVLSPLSSAIIPAIYWEKKIFVLRENRPGYPSEMLRANYSSIFNFIDEPTISLEQLESGIRANKEEFATFGFTPDGKAAQRVFDVIRTCIS